MASDRLDEALAAWQGSLHRDDRLPRPREAGRLLRVTSGIARVTGLPSLGYEELVRFADDSLGIAIDLGDDEAGVVLVSDRGGLRAGMEAEATGRLADFPVGDELLGRVVDATGQPLDDAGAIETSERWPVERDAPAIMARAPVGTPLQTGLKAVDALVPIGRGQRELILGDRQAGKTALAVDTIINQRGTDVICIYCAVGQRGTAVARVVDRLRQAKAMAGTVVLVAAGEDPPGLRFLAPYAAMSLGEHFMGQGRDVLLVYDDLTRHARAYRELSLLLRRPPGREAYPGDIFYIHSRLLERATHLREEHGGGSLTALPIIETQAQNLSAYIPTNLISITDGQIYVSPRLFRKGLMPAVDIGQSVSRVGGKAQLPAYRAVAGDLRLAYAQFEELETFSRFATRLDEDTRARIERGRRVRALLKQAEGDTMTPCEQIAVMLAVNEGLFDTLELDAVADAEQRLRHAVREQLAGPCERIQAGSPLDDTLREQLLETARRALATTPGEADHRADH